ncbi:MAG: aldehyde dehydrogenase [Chitinophagales bacterium]
MEKLLNYINGKLLPPKGEQWLDNIEPATGKCYSKIPLSNKKDLDIAVEAAQKAFPEWSNCGHEIRSEWLLKLSDAIEAHMDELVAAESKDNGKPEKLARAVDIPRASANFRFFAKAASQFASESHFMEGEAINYTLRRPLGIVGCISPWNLPLYLFTWKIAPALATGNCVIAKPSEITPMTAFLLSKICIEIGFPKGVLNILHGNGAEIGQEIVSHPKIKAISFTGGTQTGRQIAATAAPMFKKLSLELGGKNPNIIFDDANFESALNTSVKSSFANQGQICLCGSRIFIQESIYKKFKPAFVAKVKALNIGDPLDPKNQMGAVVSKAHLEKIEHYVDLAVKSGGKIIAGGKRISLDGRCKQGYFFEPTIIEGLDAFCQINQEEIFGPVVSLIPFKEEQEVLEFANSTAYGLSSTIWTNNLNRAHRMAEKIESGIVWVNTWLLRDLRTPFGGTKQSGVGREGGWEAMRFFTEAKNICIKYQ